jgi:ABC-2 type transport system permease protein
MRRVLYLVQKEFRQLLRNRPFLVLTFLSPVVQLIILGLALTTEVKNVPIAFVDNDHTSASREIREAFTASGLFDFSGMASSEAQAARLLDDWRVKIVAVIPHNFQSDMKGGRVPAVQLLVDGVDGNSAAVSLGYATATLAQVQQRWGKAAAHAQAAPGSSQPSRSPGTPRVVPRMWYNPDLDNRLNTVPMLVGILLITTTTFLMAQNIVREKEIGTLEQIMVTPVRGIELMIGKMLPFTILGFLQMTVGVVAAGLIFGIWAKGSLLLLYCLTVVFCLSTAGIGIFASTLASTQRQAMFVVQFLLSFATLTSGLFTPIANMPDVIQAFTYANPLRYFFIILREIYLKGTTFRFLWKETAALAIIGAVMLVGATLRFQKRLK